MHVIIRGYTVFEPDTQRGTTIGWFVLNGLKYFTIVPLQNYRLDHVSGANGANFTVLSKAESPGTQFAGVLLEASYLRGRESLVTIGPAGTRPLPKTLASWSRGITQSQAKSASEASGTYTLNLNASRLSNYANESFEATVTRFSNSFIARGYTLSTPTPAE